MYIILLSLPALVLALLLFYRLWFLRNPGRPMPKGEKILSPADGTIARIIPIRKTMDIRKGLMGKVRAWAGDVTKDGYLIVIVMTPMDMHYQKAPCDCRVLGTRHVPGKFHNAVTKAREMKATFENEHNIILLDTKYGRMKVIQVAGVLVRRVHCFVEPGQKLKKGEDLGVVKLGSQVCFIMPKLKLKVKEGEHVLARATVMAEP